MENRNHFLCMDSDGTILFIRKEVFQAMWNTLVKSEIVEIRSSMIPFQNTTILNSTIRKYLKGELKNE